MRQRGDTIIEVLLAVAVFSMLAIGTLIVMNQGTSSAQRALEVTLVKQQIDGQAEALRALAQDNLTQRSIDGKQNTVWAALTGAIDSTQIDTDTNSCPTAFNSVFALNAKTADKATAIKSMDLNGSSTPPPYAKIIYDGAAATSYGVWVEKRTTTEGGLPDAFDFYVKACWYSSGLSVPMRLQTTVRLYDA